VKVVVVGVERRWKKCIPWFIAVTWRTF